VSNAETTTASANPRQALRERVAAAAEAFRLADQPSHAVMMSLAADGDSWRPSTDATTWSTQRQAAAEALRQAITDLRTMLTHNDDILERVALIELWYESYGDQRQVRSADITVVQAACVAQRRATLDAWDTLSAVSAEDANWHNQDAARTIWLDNARIYQRLLETVIRLLGADDPHAASYAGDLQGLKPRIARIEASIA
jgi:hypothetical protein